MIIKMVGNNFHYCNNILIITDPWEFPNLTLRTVALRDSVANLSKILHHITYAQQLSLTRVLIFPLLFVPAFRLYHKAKSVRPRVAKYACHTVALF